MRQLSVLFAACAALIRVATAGTLYLPAYPAAVLVFDEQKAQIVDRIPLNTGAPLGIRLSPDHKKIYVTTIDRNGIEVIDVASRKVTNNFVLNTADKQFRIFNGAADPEGKLYYAVTKEIDKFPEHYEVARPKYTVIDLAQQKIVRTVEIPKEEEGTNQGDFGVGSIEVSPDGKYVYQFGEKITILQASDFKVVDHIDLASPYAPGMENIHFGGDLDLINETGQHTAMFVSSDPVVHNRVFGLARFDLNTRDMNFKPIGPAPAGIAGFEVTPDKKKGYAVVTSGIHGTKRCEFWSFDLTGDRITQRAEVPCRTRFTLGISTDGKKLYIYGAGFDIEVYDAATLKYEKTWDLNTDVTYGGIVELP
ncbi:MAG: hypothetical protein JO336_11770 [Acidobacteriia bacterium]|nr:hypothetical protein [Terriglobia bacterium]